MSRGGISRAATNGQARSILLYAIGFMWFGILVAWISGDFNLFPDSPGYEVSQGFPLSFVGDSLRAWPTPLLFSLNDSYRAQTFMQALLYGASWTAVIWVFLRHFGWPRALVSSGALVSLALTPLYLQWTMTILSEATTLSLVLFGVAAAQAFMQQLVRGSPSRALLFILGMASMTAFGLAAVSRLTLVMILVSIGLILGLASWRSGQRPLAGFLVAILVVLVGYTVWVNSRIDEYWGVSRAATYYGYLTASDTRLQNVLADPLFAHMTDIGPECLAQHRASFGGITAPDPYQLRGHLATACPEGVAWLEANFQREYGKYVITHPSYTSRYLLTYLPQVSDAGGYGGISSVLPAAVASLYTSATDVDHDFRPIYLWLALWVCSSFLMIRLLVSKREIFTLVIVPVVASAASVLVMLATVLTTNLEEARVSSQASALLIATVIILCTMLARRPDSARQGSV